MVTVIPVVYALLFAKSASIMHVDSGRFQQAYVRRLLVLMWSTYVDDSNVVDFKDDERSGLHLGRRGFQL